MRKIYVATKVRGIFKMLFSSEDVEAEFCFDNSSLYNTSKHSKFVKILYKIFNSNIADKLGLIQRIRIYGKNTDYYWSYNRFLKSDKPYILYVEHPIAVYHYRIARGKSLIGSRVVSKALNDKNLKAIVCQAKFTEDTFRKLVGNYDGIITQIYPMLPENLNVNKTIIEKRAFDKKIHILFVAQGSRFISKCAPELIIAFRQLNEKYGNIVDLTILTQVDIINPKYIADNSDLDIIWLDYKLTSEQMSLLYAKSTILVVVSSDDSINSVVLEAIQAGLPVISSSMSGFPEMVKDGCNGFTIDPKWWFFDKECVPNPKIWNNRKRTIYNDKIIDDRIVQFIKEKIVSLVEDRNLLMSMSLESYRMAHSAPFSKDYITKQWNELFDNLDTSEMG